MTMQPNNKCTCPSGDGSLRWPCPVHPAASAHEAVAWMTRKALDRFAEHRAGNADAAASSYAYAMPDDDCFVPLYAAPVTAAPAMESMGKRKLIQLQGDGFIVNGVAIYNPDTGQRGLVDYLGYVGWQGTPAAPGIDLRQFRDAVIAWSDKAYEESHNPEHPTIQQADRLLALIDASHKGERVSNPDELAFAARGFLSASFAPIAEESTLEMRDTYSYWHRRLLRAAGGAMDYEQATYTAADSPKGGSEARDAARWRHARTILPVSVIEEGQAMLRQFGGRTSEAESARADAAIDAAMQASNAEVRP